MPEKLFRVGRAKTGLGLFAAVAIKKGSLIVRFTGQRIPTQRARMRERKYGSKNMFEIDARWTIDGSSRRNLARYANHACRPNTEAVLRRGEIWLRAIKPIPANAEITFDYGEEYFALFIAPQGCRCAACAARSETKRSARIGSSNRPGKTGARRSLQKPAAPAGTKTARFR